jgi:two-component system chemotaxis sensor kinase CheA
MDSMLQCYMEETEDMLQKAEECIIRLEMQYSSEDVNELFRIAHTIKGSSHMVGYEDIGNLMHRLEDMLDCARNGSILFDQSIVPLCFDGLDIVKKMLRCKTAPCAPEMMEEHIRDSSRISESIEGVIKENKQEKRKKDAKPPELGIVSTLLNKVPKGKNEYYLTFLIEKDAPMISPVLMMILKEIEDIGTLMYCSVTDEYFSESAADHGITAFHTILSTDIAEAELYTYFALFYVEKINIINLTRSIHEVNDYCFNETDHTPFIILKVLRKLYNIVFNQPKEFKGNKEERSIVRNLQSEVTAAFAERKNKSKADAYVKEFNELFKIILKIYDGKLRTNEKLWAMSQEHLIKLIGDLYHEIRGKYVVRIYQSQKDCFIQNLNHFIAMVNKATTSMILIDISKLNILHENELKDLIKIKKHLQDENIEIGIIAEGAGARRMMNIFDSIRPVEDFSVFTSEMGAILGMFLSEESFDNISNSTENTKGGSDGPA